MVPGGVATGGMPLVKMAKASFARINELVGVVEWPSSLAVNFRDSPSSAGSEAQRVGEM